MWDTYLPKPYVAYFIPLFLIFILIEMYLLHRRNQRYRLNDTVTNLALGVYSQVLAIFYSGVVHFCYIIFYENARLFTVPDKFIFSVICFILVDLLYYFYHRSSHECSIIWGSHEAHHQSEEYNLSVALRQGAFQTLFLFPFYIPLAVLGFHPLVFFTCYQFNLIYQFLLHTTLVDKLGFLEIIFNTPSHHRVHHGVNPEYLDKNHGGVLIVWDKIFGTFCLENTKPTYGTVTPLASFNPVWANFRYWAYLLDLSLKTKKLSEKIKVWVSSPGYIPKDLVDKNLSLEASFEIFQKYDPKISGAQRKLAFILFILASIMSVLYLSTHHRVEDGDLVVGVFILYHFYFLSKFLDFPMFVKREFRS